jgi:hypothetical protein
MLFVEALLSSLLEGFGISSVVDTRIDANLMFLPVPYSIC